MAGTLWYVVCLVAALAALGCGLLPGQEPVHYAITFDNRSGQAVTFRAVVGGETVPTASTRFPPGVVGPIFPHLGVPPQSDPVFAGGTCTVVELVAEGPDGTELGRKPPGLCFGDTWVLDDSGTRPT